MRRLEAKRLVVVISTLAFLAVSADDRPGRAQGEDEAVSKMKELGQQAETDFKGGDFESAKIGLLEAIARGRKAGHEQHEQMARAQVALGAVYLNGYKDKARATKYLEAAVKIKPDVKVPKALGSPAADELLASLRASTSPPPAPSAAGPAARKAAPAAAPGGAAGGAAAVAASPAAAPGEGKTPRSKPNEAASGVDLEGAASAGKTAVESAPLPASKTGAADASDEPDFPAEFAQALYCPMPDEAPPGEPIPLRCAVKPGVDVARVLLFFRRAGQEEFTSKRMKQTKKGWHLGVVPAEAVEGRAVQVYVEARDASDQTVASAGRPESPNLILVRDGAAPVSRDALVTLGAERGDRGGGADRSVDDPLLGAARERAARAEARQLHRRGAGSIFIVIAGGASRGWHPATNAERRGELRIGSGPAAAGVFTVLPEVGYQLTDAWAFSVQARYQHIPMKGRDDEQPGAPVESAFAALARVQRFFGRGNAQFVLSASAGVGAFRLYVAPRPNLQLPGVAPLTFNDTIKSGAFLVGPGGGFLYHFTEHLALTLEARALVGAPDVAAIVDLSGGVQISF